MTSTPQLFGYRQHLFSGPRLTAVWEAGARVGGKLLMGLSK
jgi:hypothetical protein